MSRARRAVVSATLAAVVGAGGVGAHAADVEPTVTASTVASYEDFAAALADCGELSAGDTCTITIAENIDIPDDANPAYDGAAHLDIRGTGEITVRSEPEPVPDDGPEIQYHTRFLHFDGEFTDATLTVENLNFDSFRGQYNLAGGVMWIEHADDAWLTDLTFANSALEGSVGGALKIDHSRATIADSSFIDNVAITGGAINLSSTELVVNDSYFRGGDSGPGSAGGIYMGSGSDVDINRSAFVEVESWNGGSAISGDGATTLDITSSIFANNGAGERVAIGTDGDMTFTDSTLVSEYDVAPFALRGDEAEVQFTGSVVNVPEGTDLCSFNSSQFTSGGHNWLSASDCVVALAATDTVGEPAGLLPAVTGTGLVIPASDSPLRDLIPADACTADLDFLGSARPQGEGCEVGAVEIAGEDFSDVDESHPFVAEVTWLASADITTGYSDGTFRPATGVSRQAMAAFLKRFVGDEYFEVPDTATFQDVPVSHPFFAEIEWLAAMGVTDGYEDGTFRPTAGVSRQAMAAFLFRLSGEPEVAEPSEPSFSDVPATHPFAESIEWLAGTGITSGYPDGSFRASATVSRQAMAAFLSRLELPPPTEA